MQATLRYTSPSKTYCGLRSIGAGARSCLGTRRQPRRAPERTSTGSAGECSKSACLGCASNHRLLDLGQMSGTWLVPHAQRKLTTDRYDHVRAPQRCLPLEAVIYHYSVSEKPLATVDWLTRADDAYVSAHFVIARDGAVYQLAPLEDRCFHAGGKTSTLFGRRGVNERTIGIEFINWGPLTRTAEGLLHPRDLPARRVDPTDVVAFDDAPHGHVLWQPFTWQQKFAAADLVEKIVAAYPALQDRARHLGHSDVDPTRKIDPGPAFPWDFLDVVPNVRRVS